MPAISVIIPAAGVGSRMQSSIPKPFLDLDGRTILGRTLSCFNEPRFVHEIIVATSPAWHERVREIAESEKLSPTLILVPGGAERMYSILNALSVLSDESEYVAVHDAVRPFVSRVLLERLIEAVAAHPAVAPSVPVTDTIKITDSEGFVVQTPDRNRVRAVQTPQIFRKDLILASYDHAVRNEIFGTDDATLAERYGVSVKLIEGDPGNIKVTYPEDIERAMATIRKKP